MDHEPSADIGPAGMPAGRPPVNSHFAPGRKPMATSARIRPADLPAASSCETLHGHATREQFRRVIVVTVLDSVGGEPAENGLTHGYGLSRSSQFTGQRFQVMDATEGQPTILHTSGAGLRSSSSPSGTNRSKPTPLPTRSTTCSMKQNKTTKAISTASFEFETHNLASVLEVL